MNRPICLTKALFTLLAVVSLNAVAGERPTKGGPLNPGAIYHNYCSVCHGDRGDGNSRAKNSLVPPPRDFTRASELTRETMLTIITHGKPGTAMTAWKTQLDAREIVAVTDYIRATFMQISLTQRSNAARWSTHRIAWCAMGIGVKAPRLRSG